MCKDWKAKITKLCFIPQRYVLGIMMFFAIVNAYTMRISLSMAITEMVKPFNESAHVHDPNSCRGKVSRYVPSVRDVSKMYNWDERTQGLILSSFYWGYLITHLPGGLLAEKFGGKHALGIGLLITAIFTLLTPYLVVASKGNWGVLVALRVIEGLGEGPTYPALNVMLASWVPLEERGRIGSMVYAGGQVGTIVCNLVSGQLIKVTKEWSCVFYVFGALGVVWYIFWNILCYARPEDHPFISEKEREYLSQLGGISAIGKKMVIPWKAIFTSVPIGALVVAQIGYDWGFYTMVTDLPKYMKDVLKFNVGDNGLYSSLPYFVMWITSMVAGVACDICIKRKIMSVTFARKFFTSIAAFGPATFIVAASYSGCNRLLAVAMFTMAMGFMGAYYCGIKVNSLDLAPHYAGTLMALVNGTGSLTGIIAPYIVGIIAKDRTLMQWRTIFWITFGIFVTTCTIYNIFGSAERQPWSEHESADTDDKQN